MRSRLAALIRALRSRPGLLIRENFQSDAWRPKVRVRERDRPYS